MPADAPKLRSDLIESRQMQAGQVVFVVKDPLGNKFFRLKEEEHFIASQLDGRTPLETIRRRVEERFQATLSAEALAQFIATLGKTKLLENGHNVTNGRPKRGRLRGSLLYLRFKVCDPDALFGMLASRLRLCFTAGFMAVSAAIIVAAVLLGAASWEGLYPDLAALIRWDALPWLWAALVAVSIAHEFAHGVTCKHFGGQVRELGFLLTYFLPAFYCNVSDAWLFAERRKRLWVGFAGPYFELFVWACAVLAWRVTEADTWANTGARAVMAISGIKTLVNFNPLIKLDGYYLLSDLLNLPNLRRRAFGLIGDGLKRLVGLSATAAPEIPRQQRWIYFLYGLVAAVFSFSFLAFAVVKLAGSPLIQNRPEAFALAAGLLIVKLGRRFRRLFGRSAAGADPEDSSLQEPSAEPSSDDTDPAPNRPGRKRIKVSPRFVTLLALLCAVGPSSYFGRMELRVSGPFSLLPIRNADVRPEVGGTIEEICVDEGDRVGSGDLVARLSDRAARNYLQRAEAEAAQTQAQLRQLLAGPRREEIELAQIAVARAENRAQLARRNLERDQELMENDLLAQREFELTQHAVIESTNEVAEARKRLELLQAGSRPEEIEAMRASLRRLQSQRHYLEEQLRLTAVTSPAAGIVATPSRELKQMVGRVVQEGELIARVDELSTVEVETPISEKDIADVAIGQPVALKARAYPGKTFFGTVTSIGTTINDAAGGAGDARATSGNVAATGGPPGPKTVLVTTRITNPDLLLKPGMTGMIKISCGKRRIVDLVLRRIARTVRVEFWSWW